MVIKTINSVKRPFHSLSSKTPSLTTTHAAPSLHTVNQLKSILDDCIESRKYMDIRTVLKAHARIVKFGLGVESSLVSSLMLTYIGFGRGDLSRKLLHENPLMGFDLVSSNKLIAGFMKKGEVDAAKRVFFDMSSKDVVSWNSVIGGCVKNSRFEEALKLFRDMCSSGLEPDEFTFSSVIAGCAGLGALDHAFRVHSLIIEKKLALNGILLAAIIDMYAKCGKIEIAKEVFDSTPSTDVSVWNAMITGLAVHGLASDAISVFSMMDEKNVAPDAITFLGILTACRHCGLVDLGQRYFNVMKFQFLIEPQIEHYGAIVDLLGRAGCVEEAYDTIKAMPMEPDVVIWRTLLSACRTHKVLALGEIALGNISSLDSGDYVLLSNTYCSLKRWTSSANTRDVMRRDGVHKDRGKSWVELAGVVYHFKAGDRSHPETEAIEKVLKQLFNRAKLEGFIPATELVLMDVSEEEKEENLKYHSEKLALAFGVLRTSPIMEIRISKNLRTCHDCHSFFKFVSRVLRRVIIVRDRVRFHKFEGGSCSCLDYW